MRLRAGLLICCCMGLAACTASAPKGPDVAVSTPSVGRPAPPTSAQAALSRMAFTPYAALGQSNNDGLAPNESSYALAQACLDAAGYRSRKAAEIPNYDPDRAVSAKQWQRLSRSDQIAIVAARGALEDSGVLDSGVARNRMGVVLGSGTAAVGRNKPEHNSARPTPERRAVVICMGNVRIPDLSHALAPSWTCQEAKVQHGPDLL